MKYILLLSCKDVSGIVAAVSGFLAKNDGFILESQQFGDYSTGQFFMRTYFSSLLAMDEMRAKFAAEVGEKFGMNWQLFDSEQKMKLLILVSKFGHCLNDILHRNASNLLPIEIVGVISNHQDLRNMVENYSLRFEYLPISGDNKQEQEVKIWDLSQKWQAELTILARYMQILSPYLVSHLSGKAINIHHSFLPSFKGGKPYHQAFERGVKLIGATAHYVSNELDEGPIIEQEVVRVNHSHKPEDLVAMGRDIECTVLARAIKFHSEHRVIINGNKTVVFA